MQTLTPPLRYTHILSILITMLISDFSFGQNNLRYDNYIYEKDIQTVLLVKNMDDVYDPVPVVILGQMNGLRLMFDQLKAQNDFYQYTYIHCDANWQPSRLQQTEYLGGNFFQEIKDFQFSTNTFQRYVHYDFSFPTAEMEPLLAGNYLMVVYRNFNMEEVVLTRRFMVLNPRCKINAWVSAATNVGKRNFMHEIDFEVDHKDFVIPNPFNDVQAVIMQNNSWIQANYGIKPLFSNGDNLNFNYEEGNLLNGGHEFRFFDIRSLRFFSNNVSEKYRDSFVNVVLKPDQLRSHLNYVYTIDYNGKRVIQNQDGRNIVVDGDYALVHFFLKTNNKLPKDVYLYGELSDWRLNEDMKLEWMPDYGGYYKMVKLKQSYYNYLYATPGEDGKPDFLFTEGNHSDTENDYTVLVYHKNQFMGHDELIGIQTVNSGRLGQR